MKKIVIILFLFITTIHATTLKEPEINQPIAKQKPFLESVGLKSTVHGIKPLFWGNSIILKAESGTVGGVTFKSLVNYPITLRAVVWGDASLFIGDEKNWIERDAFNRFKKGMVTTSDEALRQATADVNRMKREGVERTTTGTLTLLPKTSVRVKYNALFAPALKSWRGSTISPEWRGFYRIFCIKTDTKELVNCSQVIQMEDIRHNKADVIGPLGPKASYGPLNMKR